VKADAHASLVPLTGGSVATAACISEAAFAAASGVGKSTITSSPSSSAPPAGDAAACESCPMQRPMASSAASSPSVS